MGQRVSGNILQLVFVYLIRVPEMMQLAEHTLRPAHFHSLGIELGCGVIYEILLEHYSRYKALPSKNILLAEFDKRAEAIPFSPEQLVDATNLIKNAFDPAFDDVNRNWRWAQNKLVELINERCVLDPLKRSIESGTNIPELVSRLNQDWIKSRVNTIRSSDPFDVWASSTFCPKVLTGAAWFDLLTNGGLYPGGGEVIGYIGGTGYGKTMSAVHLTVSLASRSHHVLYASYEQAITGHTSRDLVTRIVACSSGVPKGRLILGESGLSDTERRKVDQARIKCREYIHMMDMSGTQEGVGVGGTKEIENCLIDYANEGKPIYMVVIDWFGMMVSNFQADGKSEVNTTETRHRFKQETSNAVSLASRYNTNFYLLQQMATAAYDSTKPKVTDAEEAKNFPQMLHHCFSMTKPADDLFVLGLVKSREVQTGELVLKREPELNMFHETDYVRDPRGHNRFIRPNDQDRILDDDESANERDYKIS